MSPQSAGDLVPTATRSAPAKAAATKATAKPRKRAGKDAFQDSLVPDVDPNRPQDHKGIPVVREELIGSLPNGAKFKFSKLHLSDGTEAFACRDCLFTGDSKVDVMHHRNDEHGSRYGKKPPKLVYAKDTEPYDVVLSPRGDAPAPVNIMEMTIAEVLSLMPTIGALGELVDRAEHERDLAQIELDERRRHDRENNHKIDAYESLQAEVVERRVAMRNTGSYEELKAEVADLRAWKKKMINRLSGLGFHLTDEEQQ